MKGDEDTPRNSVSHIKMKTRQCVQAQYEKFGASILRSITRSINCISRLYILIV